MRDLERGEVVMRPFRAPPPGRRFGAEPSRVYRQWPRLETRAESRARAQRRQRALQVETGPAAARPGAGLQPSSDPTLHGRLSCPTRLEEQVWTLAGTSDIARWWERASRARGRNGRLDGLECLLRESRTCPHWGSKFHHHRALSEGPGRVEFPH